MAGGLQRLLLYLLSCSLAAAQLSFWLDVPFVKQPDNGCGAASIAMVMGYWRHQSGDQPTVPSVDEIQHALYSRQARGIRASDLGRYLQHHGFRTFAIHGEWADLEQHLQKGRPLIVALRSGSDRHYVVITGLDTQQDVVLKHDPAVRALLRQRRSEFEKEWQAAGNWTLLAVPDAYSASPH
jgi:ABC-type bacteriocin/lantibiotic exporter with double-glycine peptidase domain